MLKDILLFYFTIRKRSFFTDTLGEGITNRNTFAKKGLLKYRHKECCTTNHCFLVSAKLGNVGKTICNILKILAVRNINKSKNLLQDFHILIVFYAFLNLIFRSFM